jgi:GH15 family glucan-1,4-alpha-glucosidase
LSTKPKAAKSSPSTAVSGEAKLEEWEAPGLSGYRGDGAGSGRECRLHAGPARRLWQIILSNVQAFFDERLFRKATKEDFESLERVGERAWAMHDQPDAGLWEFRTRTSVHTYSSVMSWAACDRLANAAGILGLEDRAALWNERAAAIRARIEKEAWYQPEQRFAATFGGDELDASLLQLVDMRFLAPGRSALRSTFEAVERGFAGASICSDMPPRTISGCPETAFNFCTFWLIEALHLRAGGGGAGALREDAGAADAARAPFRGHGFPDGELWGNYPQTYSLVGLINCAGPSVKPWSAIR